MDELPNANSVSPEAGYMKFTSEMPEDELVGAMGVHAKWLYGPADADALVLASNSEINSLTIITLRPGYAAMLPTLR